MTPLEDYLRELRDIRSTGAAVKETSYYPALSKLLSEVGKGLKPKVRCVLTLANRGAGLPDGGLFTPDQFQKPSDGEPLPGQNPSRGVIEIKSTGDDAWVTADSEQVTRYWRKYRQVLVTNYRDFVLVGQDAEGKAVKLESFRLAENERAFWAAASTPRTLAQTIGDRFLEYIQRVMRHAVPIAAPEDVAWFLASYARDAKARIEGVDLPALATVRAALEEALGLKFQGEKGEHFFRSSLVQTLFYGVFSAWVLWAKQHPRGGNGGEKPPIRFDWMSTARYLRVPMIRKLFYLVADPQELEALKLTEVLDWTAMVLNRVDRGAFFEKFQESHAVQYFYEPFLEAFDPDLRKQMGVWYTPPEIVKYMVERVDTVLRQELGVPLGLADKNVYVLDPCCGTGSYLVEVLDRIHRTIKERGEDGLTASDLKDAAQHRVFGFEILPAPFVVSHLQLGLLLQNLGAPLSESKKERVGVYLTNALTGWEPPKGPKKKLLFPELEEERDAAEHVKREVPILVILGNPPYNSYAGVSPEEEQGLVEPYKNGLISKWGIKKFNLDDLYVRFFRLAERRIAEGKPGKGIVCYISNFSYLSDPSFVAMRECFLKEFDQLWFDCMNGDSRETGKLTPEGKPDPSVFSTEYNREGIRVGTAIGLLVRVGEGSALPREPKGLPYQKSVRFRHFWGVSKNANLVESLNDPNLRMRYEPAQPEMTNRYSFRPSQVTQAYLSWPSIDLLPESQPTLGILENRRDALISINSEPLEARMRRYLDPSVDWATLEKEGIPLAENMARFDAKTARAKALTIEELRRKADRRLTVRPFNRRLMVRPLDVRWCYYTSTRPIWNEPRPAYVHQCWPGNATFVTRRKGVASPEGVPFCFTSAVGAQHGLNTDAYYVPLRLRSATIKKRSDAQSPLAADKGDRKANLSESTRAYLNKLGINNPDADYETSGLIWMHSLAIGYCPAYLSENRDGIRQDWPRIPLPDSKSLLLASAALGRQIAALLDTENAAGAVREPPLQNIAVPTRVGGGQLHDTKETNDLAVTAGWGHGGKGGITMPGKGRIVERDFTPEERVAAGLPRHSETGAAGIYRPTKNDDVKSPLLGGRTCDVYLNDVDYWKNVPIRVWEYTIGGYQVMKKWLSYREEKLLKRALTKDEVRYVQEMARRIAAILLLEPDLDTNYASAKAHAYPWRS